MQRTKDGTVRELELLLQLRDRVACFICPSQRAPLFFADLPSLNGDALLAQHSDERGCRNTQLLGK